jgi:putative hemolysin
MSMLKTPAIFTTTRLPVSDAAAAPAIEFGESRYVVRFARTEDEIDAALRLRFEVFNLELNEGLDASFISGRDEDRFDASCHHLIVLEKATGSIVGTYRVRTIEAAGDAFGFYSSTEFTLETLPHEVLAASVETGRACIARAHRNSRVLFLLWKGLALYLTARRKRYLFGCCSLSSQDFTEGRKAMRQLARGGFYHPFLEVGPRAEFAAQAEDFLSADDGRDVRIPPLFEIYLRLGAKICGAPVIDRQFKTIDFFVIVDVETMPPKYFKMFFS